eukprot:TRINITY_DN1300_c0_g1_i1.p1 TRINITY_DN1300_c0_g1~~TRINITY_DN1300_c0_g1_i1.p1  ORF type:complete len:540 (+),score=73.97 TRINITY_DN1300_c0_g1_i1:74-1693(+)
MAMVSPALLVIFWLNSQLAGSSSTSENLHTCDAGTCDADNNLQTGLSLIQMHRGDLKRRSHFDGSSYFWPNGYGRPFSSTMVSQFAGPWNLGESFMWNWTQPEGKYSGFLIGGPLVDDEMNMYVTTHEDGVFKVSPEGKTLLKILPPQSFGKQFHSACLWDGKVIGTSKSGTMWAANKDTGKLLWSTKIGKDVGVDTGFVTAGEGIAIGCHDSGPAAPGDAWPEPGAGCNLVAGVNATTGEKLWDFKTDEVVWNLKAVFPQDGSCVFQDELGGVYRIRLADGKLIWKAGTPLSKNTMTDGGVGLGNGIVYSVSAYSTDPSSENATGWVEATRLADGKQLWRTQTPLKPNSYPTVGKVGKNMTEAVVVAMGVQGYYPLFDLLRAVMPQDQAIKTYNEIKNLTDDQMQDQFHNPTLYSQLAALDPATGEYLWRFEPPPWRRMMQAGDMEGFLERTARGKSPICYPGPWSSPAIDSEGKIYAGNQNGIFYALHDVDGDGQINPETEVQQYNMGTCFLFPGAVILPDRMAISTCDTLFTFRSH